MRYLDVDSDLFNEREGFRGDGSSALCWVDKLLRTGLVSVFEPERFKLFRLSKVTTLMGSRFSTSPTILQQSSSLISLKDDRDLIEFSE